MLTQLNGPVHNHDAGGTTNTLAFADSKVCRGSYFQHLICIKDAEAWLFTLPTQELLVSIDCNNVRLYPEKYEVLHILKVRLVN